MTKFKVINDSYYTLYKAIEIEILVVCSFFSEVDSIQYWYCILFGNSVIQFLTRWVRIDRFSETCSGLKLQEKKYYHLKTKTNGFQLSHSYLCVNVYQERERERVCVFVNMQLSTQFTQHLIEYYYKQLSALPRNHFIYTG